MMGNRNDLLETIVGAVIVVVLQIVVAPYIAMGPAVPDFIVGYVVAVCLARSTPAPILAFVLGMIDGLLGQGPLGAMAFLLLLAAFFVTRVYLAFNNDTLFMPLVFIGVAVLLIEVCYGLLMVGTSVSASVGDALIYRALPCALYDFVVSAITYVIALRIYGRPERSPHLTQLR